MLEKVNISDKADMIRQYWQPKIIGEVNETYIKIAKFKGEFLWHSHSGEDELFIVLKGKLGIRLRDRKINLEEGEMLTVPRGTEHMPFADEDVVVLLIEPKSTVNTGDAAGDRTSEPEWI